MNDDISTDDTAAAGASGIDETHDAGLLSWVASANHKDTEFPIQNLPFGMFRRRGGSESFRPGVAIGSAVVDLLAACDAQWLPNEVAEALRACAPGELNGFMARGPAPRVSLRRTLSQALQQGSAVRAKAEPCLVDMTEVEHALPCRIGDYTDFYTGIHHATAVGMLFRPDAPLLPNYKWLPIGYHGRSSSIGVSGQRFPRPLGQLKGNDDAEPRLGPSQRLDCELEMAAYIGAGNGLGSRIGIEQAEAHVFGLGLLNDWSARDIQAWEYQPLGPFLAKNFASTVSPWIVTLEALAPFRAGWSRPAGDPEPLPYLDSAINRERGGFDIGLELWLRTAAMAEAGEDGVRLMRSNFRDAYWTVAQMVAHHSVGGCNLRAGDLLGSGTQSGPGAGEGGSLLELTDGGRKPLALPGDERRSFLQDGDSVILRARCERSGFRGIGFGDCAGTLTAAV